jgi:hypothetical protein
MNLVQRYKRLRFWSKLGAWGAVASIVCIPLALITLCHPTGNKTTIIGDNVSRDKVAVSGDDIAGDKINIVGALGDYIAGDKVTYKTYITQYTQEGRSSEIVSNATLNKFFQKYQSACSQIIQIATENYLEGLPGFLKMPYDMSVVVSDCHGVGFQFTVPSDRPEITLSQTSAPIEKYYFTKYTNHPEFPKTITFVRVKAKGFITSSGEFVGSDQCILVEEGADAQIIDMTLRYSKEEGPKIINYLWLFGSNSKEYWEQLDPVKLAQDNTPRLIKVYRIKLALESSQ